MQTETTEYSIRNTLWKHGHGDVLAEVAVSCKRHGLKLGVYVCPRDDHFGAKTGGVCATPDLQARYDVMYRKQLTEVLTQYGPIVEVWFDGSIRTPVADLLQRYQPHAIVFQSPAATIRWVGNEDGYAPYPCWNGISEADARSGTSTALNGDPDGHIWLPNEVDVSIRRPDWFWSTKTASKVLSVDELLSIYYRSVGRGAQLLLNVPANRNVLLSAKDCDAATRFGTEIKRRFGIPIASISGRGAQLSLSLPAARRIDTIVLQEEIALGERVRRFTVEARNGNRWQVVGTGQGPCAGRCIPEPCAHLLSLPSQLAPAKLVQALKGRSSRMSEDKFSSRRSVTRAGTSRLAGTFVREWTRRRCAATSKTSNGTTLAKTSKSPRPPSLEAALSRTNLQAASVATQPTGFQPVVV